MSGATELTLHGPAGAYQLQVSSNLVNWTTLTTITVSGRASSYTDGDGSLKSRFYRALKQP